jgi:hypothetical protein
MGRKKKRLRLLAAQAKRDAAAAAESVATVEPAQAPEIQPEPVVAEVPRPAQKEDSKLVAKKGFGKSKTTKG